MSFLSKPAEQWFSEYGESHQNPTNEILHWICVPVIVVCGVALIWALPVPRFMASAGFNWALIFLALAVAFYFHLSRSLGIGMVIFAASIVAMITALQSWAPAALIPTAVVLFVLAWIGQFIGHKIEGKKPSFFQDMVFLLIGPVWLLSKLFNRFGIKI